MLYSENANLGLLTVKTVSGEKEYRKNCRKIEGKYYAIGKDVILVEDKWLRPILNEVLYDHERKTWFLPSKQTPDIINGVIGYSKEKGLIFGYFTHNPFNNCSVVTNIRTMALCLSPDVLEGSPYTEEVGSGLYKQNANSSMKNLVNNNHKGYNIEDNNYTALKEFYERKPYKMNIEHAKVASLLKDTTFGIELEACMGAIPDFLLNRTGTCVCKDGSLQDKEGIYPPEYVTVPLKGSKGISNIVELCAYAQPRNKIDNKCSYHLHLGGFTTSRQFLVALHSLCYKIQGEVFAMFPQYKLNPKGVKEKNYCKVLPKIFKQYKDGMDWSDYINQQYLELFKYCSEDNKRNTVLPDREYNRKTKIHLGGDVKWHRFARYHWLNMINAIYSNRNTLEFRLHTPTFNPVKIVNWLLMCNAICKYAEKYPLDCVTNTKITFKQVLDYYQLVHSSSSYATFVSGYLKAYYDERVKMFKKDKDNDDNLSEHEIKKDSKYVFSYEDKTLF